MHTTPTLTPTPPSSAQELGLLGSRADAFQAAPQRLGLLVDALQRLARAEHLDMCGSALTPWSLADVRFTPRQLMRFLQAVLQKDMRYAPKGRQVRWRIHREHVNAVLAHEVAGPLLCGALQAERRAAARGAAVTSPRAAPRAAPPAPPRQQAPAPHRLEPAPPWPPPLLPVAPPPPPPSPIELLVPSPPPPLAPPSPPTRQAEVGGVCAAELSLEALHSLKGRLEQAEAEVARLRSRLSVSEQAEALSTSTLKAASASLLASLDEVRARPGAPHLFTEGAEIEFTEEEAKTVARAERLWLLDSDTVDEALRSLPGLDAQLRLALKTRTLQRLNVKVRRAFLLLNAMSRVQAQKSTEACVVPWFLSVGLFALGAPSIAIDGVRATLDCMVAYRTTWTFLCELVALVRLSYPTWWPGLRVGFADDNYQEERSWLRARVGCYNNADTNPLQQVRPSGDFSEIYLGDLSRRSAPPKLRPSTPPPPPVPPPHATRPCSPSPTRSRSYGCPNFSPSLGCFGSRLATSGEPTLRSGRRSLGWATC